MDFKAAYKEVVTISHTQLLNLKMTDGYWCIQFCCLCQLICSDVPHSWMPIRHNTFIYTTLFTFIYINTFIYASQYHTFFYA